VVGEPDKDNLNLYSATDAGAIYIYEYNGSSWTFGSGIVGINNNGQRGKAVGILDKNGIGHCFIGIPGINRVVVYDNSGSNWAYTGTDFYGPANSNFGSAIDMSENYAIIGAPDGTSGEAQIVELISGTWTATDLLQKNVNGDRFGSSVAITDNYALVGADEANGGVGAAYLYYPDANNNDEWTEPNETITPPSQTGVAYVDFGWSAGLSPEGYYIIGDPRATVSGAAVSGTTVINSLVWKPGNVQATDGEHSNRIKITWEYPLGKQHFITGFKIYRDSVQNLVGSVDATLPPSNTSFSIDDFDGIPGKEHVYQVRAYIQDGAESLPASDIGYKEADGILKGNVTTLIGSSPVPGVTITATAQVDGDYYTYTGTTTSLGEYTIPEVYYGADINGAIYTLTPEYKDHVFQPASKDVSLSSSSNQAAANFSDTTAYLVKGRVRHKDVLCGLDSIYVRAKHVTSVTGTPYIKSALTDENGEYTLVVEPSRANLIEIIIEIDNFKEIDPGMPTNDTIFYENFATTGPAPTTFNDFANFPLESVVNFTEETTYPVDLRVQNVCEDPISGDRFDIRVRSVDGCYDKVFKTSTNGLKTANLPPLNLRMTVVAVDNPTPANLTAVNYFAAYTSKLDLFAIHKIAPGLSSFDLDTLTDRAFTFHKAPDIIINGFNDFLCEDEPSPALLFQKDDYTLTIMVEEQHNGTNCSVKEGYIKITNPASNNSEPVTLKYDPNISGFPDYTFTAGNPNVVQPHIYGINFEYFSKDDDLLGSIIQAAFVDGEVPIPGNDIIVDPSDQAQFPLFVLRDPPGDGSFSYISDGETIRESVNITSTSNAGGSYFNEGELLLGGIGAAFSLDIGGGTGTNQSDDWSYEITTTQTISTSADPNFVGPKADVIMGVGIAMQYGFVLDISAGECNEVIPKLIQGITENGVNTTWTYTVQQIEDIIAGFKNDITRVDANKLEIKRDGKVMEKGPAKEFLNSKIYNWEQVLVYHSEKILPHYLLCANETKVENGLPLNYQNAITEWKDEFCPMVGDFDSNGAFKLKPASEIVWDSTLIGSYNAAATAIRKLNTGLDIEKYEFDANTDLATYRDIQYENSFGVLAENKTFGGGTTQSVSINGAQAISKKIGSSYNFKTNGSLAQVFNFESMAVATVLGIGISVTSGKVDVRQGGTFYYESETSGESENTTTNTVEIGYTLTDDDLGDQFSTSIIQGPSQNHTPYFYLFGGRSSCPPEEGTILRDDPLIATYDPATNTTDDRFSRYNVPANETANYTLRIQNNNPFNENRNMFVFLNNSSNTSGAIVRLNGNLLGDDVYCEIPAGEAQTLSLTVERGSVAYEHENLEIVVNTWCADPFTSCTGNGFASTGGDTATINSVFVSAYFQSPCSPVTLVKPEDNWVLNSDDAKLIMGMRDYQPDNPNLEEIYLQHRRLGTGDPWDFIPGIEYTNEPITATFLQAFNADLSPTQIPEYRSLYP
jgi:hypothetical protein